MEKVAVFCCRGMGDALISLILSNNLHRNQFSVTTFHPFFSGMQPWFPNVTLRKFPKLEEMEEELKKFDQLFVFFETSEPVLKVIELSKTTHPDRTYILNPIATKNRDYRYWEVGKFDGRFPFGNNLLKFCEDSLKLKMATLHNGISPDREAVYKKYPSRVVIHPTSSRAGKNWPQDKFIQLSDKLKKDGFEPFFLLSEEEKKEWDMPEAMCFSTLPETARFVYESGWMIGNDSGIGHLASSLGIPTLTICRSHKPAAFWRPCWTKGKLIYPPTWIPNPKFLRLRDRYWKKMVSVDKVYKGFRSLTG